MITGLKLWQMLGPLRCGNYCKFHPVPSNCWLQRRRSDISNSAVSTGWLVPSDKKSPQLWNVLCEALNDEIRSEIVWLKSLYLNHFTPCTEATEKIKVLSVSLQRGAVSLLPNLISWIVLLWQGLHFKTFPSWGVHTWSGLWGFLWGLEKWILITQKGSSCFLFWVQHKVEEFLWPHCEDLTLHTLMWSAGLYILRIGVSNFFTYFRK